METKGICNFCVMDNSATEIVYTDTGCNFCDAAKKELENIKRQSLSISKGHPYDCLIGLSGGVDSSYTLHLAILMGLKPLCFTIDNGWNDPRADENIMRLVEGLKVPFYRYTINLDNFKTMQAAFMQAGVKNIEIPTDHILMAASYELASKYGIKTILSGGNVATESIMPASWGHNARDLTHIKAIYHGSLKGIPTCSVWKWNWYRWVKKIKIVYVLDYHEYNRQMAIEILEKLYGYKPYGDKHCENIFTTWFQNFYLFKKYGIDKRKAHLSSLIVSGQMTREAALAQLQTAPTYPELGIEQRVLKYPKHEHSDYAMDPWYGRIAPLVRLWSS